MEHLTKQIQRLLARDTAKARALGALMQVQSGDGRLNIGVAAGDAAPDARFPIASISKMFTATLVIKLVAEGRFDLDTPIRDLLPGRDLTGLHAINGVQRGSLLTARHLLHQTSGLADYYEGGMLDEIKRNEDRAFDLDEVLRMTRAQSPLGLPDSGRAYYSDTNFQLLGAVLTEATGMPFVSLLKSRICDPLGLASTGLAEAGSAPLALTYKDRKLDLPRMLADMAPDGGIVSTLEDMTRFVRAHRTGTLFTGPERAEMETWLPLYFPFQYGLGLMRFKLPWWMSPFSETPALIGHSGATGSFAFHVPKHDLTLVGSFNRLGEERRPFGLMLRVVRLLVTEGAI